MSRIKNYVWVGLIVGLIAVPSAAQVRRGQTVRRPQATSMSISERASAVNASLAATCSPTAMAGPTAPRALGHNARVFAPNRVANTLNGVWIGRVAGEYDPQLLAKDGFLNVDYYMIVDVKRGEAFVYEEVTNRRSGVFRSKPGAPHWSYTWCARENYSTNSPRQVHEFVKVSDDVQDAREILSKSVGVKFTARQEVVLSEVWKALVDTHFFDDPKRSLAYAGVLFKPITMGSVESLGGSLLELRMVGEYRGNGQTAAKFIPKEPIHNVEGGRFLGISMSSQDVRRLGRQAVTANLAESGGDYLSASVEFDNAMVGPKSDADVAVFSTQMSFDKVVIGPLAPDATASASVSPAPRKPKK